MHRPPAHCNAIALVLILAATTSLAAESNPPAPVFEPNGTVHVPAFDLPPSTLISHEALEAQKMRASRPGGVPSSSGDIAAVTQGPGGDAGPASGWNA